MSVTHRQCPWLAIEPQQANNHFCCRAWINMDELKEAIEPAAHRIRLGVRRGMGCQSPKANGAVSHDQKNQPAQRLPSCPAERKMLLCKRG